MRLVTLFVLMGSLSARAEIVKTESGPISGFGNEVRIWKGIPYAQPPTGELRWKPPQPVHPWTEVRSANDFGPMCPQGDPAAPPAGMSEDCLTLNIWAPAKSGQKLPVFFWIHGGGFNAGSGRISGEALAKSGLVVISINYRLGALGFLAHPELTQESGHHASGNYGLMDQIAALQWVHRNIAAFGGDPDRVCIAGASAGGTSVGYLIASPLARGLFARAMLDSASRLFLPDPGAQKVLHGLTPMEQVGLQLGPHIQELRALSTVELMRRANQVTESFYAENGGGKIGLKPESHIHLPRAHDNSWWAFVDGYVMPHELREMYSSGRFNRVPVLVATCAEEGLGFSQMQGWSLDQYHWYLDTNYPEIARTMRQLYAVRQPTDVRSAVSRIITDFMFLYGSIEVAREATSHGDQAFVSRFSRVPPGAPGATHVADGPYFLGGVQSGEHLYKELDSELSRDMMRRLIRFVEKGNPNGNEIQPRWPVWDNQHPRYIEFGDRVQIRPFEDQQQMDLFAKQLQAK